MIRKNRNIDDTCSIYNGGVDLNRNYDFKFGSDDLGSSSDPCEEDYRGEFAFSEPETDSIRKLVQTHPNIISNINLHTYGNAWIYPFNYSKDKADQILKKKRKFIYEFLKEFEGDMK